MKKPLTTNIQIEGSWKNVLDDCRYTQWKDPLDREPSNAFKEKILIAEHSPIRDLIVRWHWDEIPYWVANELARHKWEKFITSSREDVTGKARGELRQDSIVGMTVVSNVQQLIDVARKRLCNRATKEARSYIEDLRHEIVKIDPFIAYVMVPNCIYRCGCPEGNKECGWFSNYKSACKHDWDKLSTIIERYNYYYDFIMSVKSK